ncbi:MAG: methyltransferase, partial [Candidatus Thorarchaeota archaeon]
MAQGIEKIREKLPGYEGKRIGLLGALAPLMISIGLGFQLFMDVVPRIFPQIQLLTQLEPLFPMLGSMIIASIGLTLLTRLWRKRIEMQERYGDLAYQKILPSGFSGAWLQMSVLLHGVFSVRSLPPGPPVNDLTISLSRSILPLIGVTNEIDIILRISLATIIVVLGIVTIARAIRELGLDTGLLVYVYFPEESEFKEHAIYSVIRHPAYLGVLLIVVSFCALRFSLYS